jgi:hypothetical protein
MIGADIQPDQEDENAVEPWTRTFNTIPTTDPNCRIVILERKDGFFSCAIERWYPPVIEDNYQIHGYWAQSCAEPSVYETAEIADREARAHHMRLF